jgi:diacylglycerol kinase (ATP)
MPSKLLQLVCNPLSGSYHARRVSDLVAALEGVGFRVALATSSPDHKFVPDATAEHVCVAGGDGTVRHVATALKAADYQGGFSVYPLGTINLIAREWAAPRDPLAFARHVIDGAAKRGLNIVAINDTHFVACASIGPDSCAVAEVSEALKARIGRLAYGVSLLKVLFRWQPPRLVVTIGGARHECGALYVANGRFYAGPWVVAPKASLADSLLQIVMLKRARRRDFIAFLLATLFGRATSLSIVQVIEASALSITADRDVAIQLDGDVGAALPASIRVEDYMLRG